MNIPYDKFLTNIRALGNKPYSINEVKTFPYRAFYLNPEKSDTLVRLILEAETQTIAMEIPKTRYLVMKDLLLGKKTPLPAKKK
jgi:hypothetical protein